MRFRAGGKFAGFLFVLTALPLRSSAGQQPAPPSPPRPKMRANAVSGVISTLCVVTNSCPPLKPLITSVLPFSSITPGGGVIVQGENFAAANGSFGQFQLVLCSGETSKLENLQWGDTFAAGTIPTNVQTRGDRCGNLFIVRSDGAISNNVNVAFIATRDFAVLPASDLVTECSDGAHDNICGSTIWGGSASGYHASVYGHDMGTDQFTVNLENGWVFYDMDFTVVRDFHGGVQPPAGFNAFSNSLQLRVHWDQEGGDLVFPHAATTTYVVNLYIMGPKGTRWKGYPY